MMRQLLRRLPSVDRWLASEQGQRLALEFSRAEVRDTVRAELGCWRLRIRAGERDIPDFFGAAFLETVRAALASVRASTLVRVINATGIVLHTNLGRAPLAPEAVAALQEAAAHYSSLEYDAATGGRGSRNDHVEALLTRLTGAEAALVVNNGAAALLLALSCFARDGEVIISRGELIEIGGSFRMPDVIAESGAHMVEVGTTNRTSLEDFERAISGATRVLLQSHPSNFRIIGFTSQPTHAELAMLAQMHGCISILDLGSGCLVDLTERGLPSEPTVAECAATGVDLVTFSGDKLLGGPQAGIVAGRREHVDRLRRHPMARAMRIDKLSLAALAATLQLYFPPSDPFERVPVLRMLAEPLDLIAARAHALCMGCGALAGVNAAVVETHGYAGGGALPMSSMPSRAVAIRAQGWTADALAERLRARTQPIIARISDDAVLFDVRTLSVAECALIGAALSEIMQSQR